MCKVYLLLFAFRLCRCRLFISCCCGVRILIGPPELTLDGSDAFRDELLRSQYLQDHAGQ